jgi:hypothetical protein
LHHHTVRSGPPRSATSPFLGTGPLALLSALAAVAAVALPGHADGAEPGAGAVHMPLATYLELLKHGAAGPAGPPVPFLLPEARYDVTVGEGGATVEAHLRVEVLAHGWVAVPVLPDGVAVESATLDGKPVVLGAAGDGGGAMGTGDAVRAATLLVDRPGAHAFEARLRLPLDEARGGRAFSLGVRPSAMTRLSVKVPEPDLEFIVLPGGASTAVERRPAMSVLNAVVAATDTVDVEWRAAPPAADGAAARIAADSASVVHFGEGVLHATTLVKLQVSRAPASSVTFALSAGVENVDVKGDMVLGHTERTEGGALLVDVALQYPVLGDAAFTITYEMPYADEGGAVPVPAPTFAVRGAARDQGVLALSAVSTLELDAPAAGCKAVASIDPTELPDWAPAADGGDPVLFAWRYHEHPYGVTATVIKHEDSPVLTTSIDDMALTTVLTREGKTVTRASLLVSNNLKQFLEVTLPAGTVLWSAFVAGRPVKPARDGSPEKLLVPLLRSSWSGGRLAAFEVELTWFGEGGALSSLGGKGELDAPVTDVPITHMSWDLYLPEGYAYLHPGGDLRVAPDRAAPERGLDLEHGRHAGSSKTDVGGAEDRDGDDDGAGERLDADKTVAMAGEADERAKNKVDAPDLAKEALAGKAGHYDLKALAEPDSGWTITKAPAGASGAAIVKGVLPVRVTLPLAGAATRLSFEKEIVKAGEPAKVRFSYVDETARGALGVLAWPLWVLAALLLVAHAGETVRLRRATALPWLAAAGVTAAGLLAAIHVGADLPVRSLLVPLLAAAALYGVWAIGTGRVRPRVPALFGRLWANFVAAGGPPVAMPVVVIPPPATATATANATATAATTTTTTTTTAEPDAANARRPGTEESR